VTGALQNSFVPVTATITCVPITPAAPIRIPTIASASTDQVALGVVSRRHQPFFGSPSPPSVERSAMVFSFCRCVPVRAWLQSYLRGAI
jgi:hypothetical protein